MQWPVSTKREEHSKLRHVSRRPGRFQDDPFSNHHAMLSGSSNEWSNTLRNTHANQGASVTFYYKQLKYKHHLSVDWPNMCAPQLFLDLSYAAVRLSWSTKCCAIARFRWYIAARFVLRMSIDEPDVSSIILGIHFDASPQNSTTMVRTCHPREFGSATTENGITQYSELR